MKKFNYTKSNYYPHFTYRKPDKWDDGELVKYSYYFSICDWAGNELDGTESENEMFDKLQETEQTAGGTQVLVYPLKDGEEIEHGGHDDLLTGEYIPVTIEWERYKF